MKTKIKNLPNKIYLQVGDLQENEIVDFNELTDVTWCEDKINDSDIEYYLQDKKTIAKGVITLCGSTRFYETFLAVNNSLTAKGYIVLSVGVVIDKTVMLDKSDGKLEKMLDKLHKEKIAMSDSIFVIDFDNYIGEATSGEIDFAKKHGKKIYRLSNGDLNKL
jgi:hypothetical protein